MKTKKFIGFNFTKYFLGAILSVLLFTVGGTFNHIVYAGDDKEIEGSNWGFYKYQMYGGRPETKRERKKYFAWLLRENRYYHHLDSNDYDVGQKYLPQLVEIIKKKEIRHTRRIGDTTSPGEFAVQAMIRIGLDWKPESVEEIQHFLNFKLQEAPLGINSDKELNYMVEKLGRNQFLFPLKY